MGARAMRAQALHASERHAGTGRAAGSGPISHRNRFWLHFKKQPFLVAFRKATVFGVKE